MPFKTGDFKGGTMNAAYLTKTAVLVPAVIFKVLPSIFQEEETAITLVRTSSKVMSSGAPIIFVEARRSPMGNASGVFFRFAKNLFTPLNPFMAYSSSSLAMTERVASGIFAESKPLRLAIFHSPQRAEGVIVFCETLVLLHPARTKARTAANT